MYIKKIINKFEVDLGKWLFKTPTEIDRRVILDCSK